MPLAEAAWLIWGFVMVFGFLVMVGFAVAEAAGWWVPKSI